MQIRMPSRTPSRMRCTMQHRMRRVPWTVALPLAALLAGVLPVGCAAPPDDAPPSPDLLIRGARIVDGTGSPWFRGNLAVTGDTIVSVGPEEPPAARVIEADGLVLAPGFIDMHAHSEYGLVVDPRALSKTAQGVTTEVLGEHLSAGPVLGPAVDDPMMVAPPIERDWTTLGGYLDRLEFAGVGPNVVSYVGSGQVRASVVGYEERAATEEELQAMEALVAQAMEEGAFALASGMAYIPNAFASTEELIRLTRVAAGYGGIYVSHLRSGIEGLAEGITIAREAGTALEIHHLNSTSGARIPEYAAMIAEARASGVDVTGNVYPYIAGWTYLRSLLPRWAQEGGVDRMLARLTDPADRERLLGELRESEAARPRWARTFVSSFRDEVDGLSILDLGEARGVTPEEGLLELLIEQEGEGFQISFGNEEPNLVQALAQPFTHIGSDGSALAAGMRTPMGKPHPRSFGTYPRVLAKYVREERLLTLEEAIRKMSAAPANRLGLADRGVLRPGMRADLILFDPDTVQDEATFEEPERYPTGIPWVFVNGVAVIAEGEPTGELPGHVLRGPGYVPR